MIVALKLLAGTDVARRIDRAVLDAMRAPARLTRLPRLRRQTFRAQASVNQLLDRRAAARERERRAGRRVGPAIVVMPAVAIDAELGDDVARLIVLGLELHRELVAMRRGLPSGSAVVFTAGDSV